jgi:hypothetical protein
MATFRDWKNQSSADNVRMYVIDGLALSACFFSIYFVLRKEIRGTLLNVMDLETIVSVGSYEGKVFGFLPKSGDDGEHYMHKLFTQPSHTGCIKAVALYGQWLVSGSTDETIRYGFLFVVLFSLARVGF